MRHAILPTVILAAGACGGDPGPIPIVEGVYAGTWNLEVGGDRVACASGLAIADQTEGAFTTRFEVLRATATGWGVSTRSRRASEAWTPAAPAPA